MRKEAGGEKVTASLPTFPRIGVSKSQTELFASCLSPAEKKHITGKEFEKGGKTTFLTKLGIRTHLVALQRRPHQHHGPHGRHHIVRRNVFRLRGGQEGKQSQTSVETK